MEKKYDTVLPRAYGARNTLPLIQYGILYKEVAEIV